MASFLSRLFGNTSAQDDHPAPVERQEARPRYCEICGKVTSQGRFVFLAESTHFVILRSKMVARCDDGAVVLTDGNRVPYDIRNSAFAFGLKNMLVQHYVCSDQCVSDLCKCPLHLREDLVDTMPAIDLTKLQGGIWWPQPLEIENVRCNQLTCDVCGSQYPDAGFKKYKICSIDSIEEQFGDPNQAAQSGRFEIVQSGLGQKTSGRYWGMKVSNQEIHEKRFCTDACAFEYSVKHQAYVSFPNIVVNGFLTFISPVQKKVNSDLGNSYCLRPTKMMPLP
jgi:hypothetical protein